MRWGTQASLSEQRSKSQITPRGLPGPEVMAPANKGKVHDLLLSSQPVAHLPIGYWRLPVPRPSHLIRVLKHAVVGFRIVGAWTKHAESGGVDCAGHTLLAMAPTQDPPSSYRRMIVSPSRCATYHSPARSGSAPGT